MSAVGSGYGGTQRAPGDVAETDTCEVCRAVRPLADLLVVTDRLGNWWFVCRPGEPGSRMLCFREATGPREVHAIAPADRAGPAT